MFLKRSGAYRQAWLIAVPALLFLGYEGVVVAHLVAVGNWGALVGPGFILVALAMYVLVIVGLVLNVVAVFAPVRLLRQCPHAPQHSRERRARRPARHISA